MEGRYFFLADASRIAVSVVRVVIISGSTLSSSKAALPDFRARSKAGAKSAVRETTSAWQPKLSAHLAKSGFFSPTA